MVLIEFNKKSTNKSKINFGLFECKSRVNLICKNKVLRNEMNPVAKSNAGQGPNKRGKAAMGKS